MHDGFFVFRAGYEYVLVSAVASLALAMLGPGAVSIDAAAGIEVTGWSGGAITLGVAVVATGLLLAVCWRREPAPADNNENVEVR